MSAPLALCAAAKSLRPSVTSIPRRITRIGGVIFFAKVSSRKWIKFRPFSFFLPLYRKHVIVKQLFRLYWIELAGKVGRRRETLDLVVKKRGELLY